MVEGERAARLGALRRRVTTYDVHRWVRTFLSELARAAEGRRRQAAPESTPDVLATIVERARAARHVVLILDYDGTLVSFTSTPDLAVADRELLALLRSPRGGAALRGSRRERSPA